MCWYSQQGFHKVAPIFVSLMTGCEVERRFERARNFGIYGCNRRPGYHSRPSWRAAPQWTDGVPATGTALGVLLSRESPQHDPEYAPPPAAGNPYNLTMTYFSESDLYSPFCCYIREKGGAKFPPDSKEEKLLMWMASNCHRLSWRRGEFVEELGKHLPVDSYGKCGKLGHLNDTQALKALTRYKFYLSFENSECREYISEKVWKESFARNRANRVRSDSQRLRAASPAHVRSFISKDFSNMSDFVEFIRALDVDNARYMQFFQWRQGTIINCLISPRSFVKSNSEVNLCYLLTKVHPHARASRDNVAT